MYEIPQKIVIDGKDYNIRNKGDYRVILDCLVALDDVNIKKEERILSALIIFYEDFNSIEDVLQVSNIEEFITKMFIFFNCGKEQSPGALVNHKLIDWNQDSQLICSAINNVANTEIRAVDYLHWWTFMGYYLAVGESALSTVVGIRSKITKGKKLEKYEQEFKRNNPEYFNWNAQTTDQREMDAYVREIWNSGK